MPSSYYYTTPIGAGMSNLAQAISSMPGRDAEQGLLAARQRLLDAQVETQGSEVDKNRAQTREHGSLADLNASKLRGQQGMSQVFADLAPRPLAGAPANTPTSALLQSLSGGMPDVSNAIAGPLPSANVPGVGMVPGAVSPAAVSAGSMPGALGLTPPAAPALMGPPMPPPAGAVPGISTAIVPGGGTGVTPELVRQMAQFSALTGMDPAKLLMMFGAGNVATAPHTADQAVSYLQSGAGEPYGQTIRGGQETIGQHATADAAATAQRAAEAAQASRDRNKIAGDRLTLDRELGDKRIEAQGARAAARRGGAEAKMSPSEEKILLAGIDEQATANGYKITPQQRVEVLGEIRQRWRGGQDMFDAAGDVLDQITQTKPAVPGHGPFDLFGAKPEQKAYVAPPRTNATTTLANPSPSSGGATAPAAALSGGAPPVPRDKTQLKAGVTYLLGNGQQATYQKDGTWVKR